MKLKYWLRMNKETLGPLGADEIQEVSGISENSLVCPVGATATSDWRKLREVPELVQALRRALAPPLPPEESSPRSESVPLNTSQRIAAPVQRAVPFMSKLTLLAFATVAAATIVGVKRWRVDRAQEETVRTELLRRAETRQQEQAKRQQVEAHAEQVIEQQTQDALRDGELVIQEAAAIASVKHFPIKFPPAKILPAIGISDTLEIRRGNPKNLEEQIAMINLLIVEVDMAMLRDGLVNANDILREHHLQWSATALGGQLYQVTCLSPRQGQMVSDTLYKYEVNLMKKILKPLTVRSWGMIGGDAVLMQPAVRGMDFDSDVSSLAPSYPLRLNQEVLPSVDNAP